MVNDNIAGAFLCNDMDLQVVEETIEKTLAFKLKAKVFFIILQIFHFFHKLTNGIKSCTHRPDGL